MHPMLGRGSTMVLLCLEVILLHGSEIDSSIIPCISFVIYPT
jgi:hypothetical protein